jgi:hypothetical protein
MEYVRFAIRFASFALLALVIGGYVFLVYRGDFPAPDLQAIATQVAPSMTASGSVIATVAIYAVSLRLSLHSSMPLGRAIFSPCL